MSQKDLVYENYYYEERERERERERGREIFYFFNDIIVKNVE